MEDRDMSRTAVYSRYEKANNMAIVTHNNIVFASLMDIPKLLDKIEELEQQVANLIADRE